MKDSILEAYLHIITEAYKSANVKLYDIVAALDKATNNFRSSWEKNETASRIQQYLNEIQSCEITVIDKEVENRLNAVKAFYSKNQDLLNDNIKPILNSVENVDVSLNLKNIVAFAVWRAIKESKSKSINLADSFKIGDRISLILIVKEFAENTYKPNYRAAGTSSIYAMCGCKDYPDIDFRFPVNDKMNIKQNDVIKINGIVSNVSTTNVQVNLKRVKIEEIINDDSDYISQKSENRTFEDNLFHLEHHPETLIKKFNDIVNEPIIQNYFADLVHYDIFEKSKEEFMNSFDFMIKDFPNAAVLKDEIGKYYDELKSIPDEKIPNCGDWYNYIK